MDYGLWMEERIIPMRIKKSTMYIVGILFLIVVAGLFLIRRNNPSTGAVIGDTSNNDVQNVVLSIKNYNYYPNTITVSVNKPVRIYLDSSVTGCLRTFTIPAFGVAKNLRTPKDYVEFTPAEKGTYKFACSMGMGTGTLIVE